MEQLVRARHPRSARARGDAQGAAPPLRRSRRMREHAYEDGRSPIGYGQTISQPYMVARMSELAALRGDERGAGGRRRLAAIRRRCWRAGARRCTRSRSARARRDARARRAGDARLHERRASSRSTARDGWPEHAPFDVDPRRGGRAAHPAAAGRPARRRRAAGGPGRAAAGAAARGRDAARRRVYDRVGDALHVRRSDRQVRMGRRRAGARRSAVAALAAGGCAGRACAEAAARRRASSRARVDDRPRS